MGSALSAIPQQWKKLMPPAMFIYKKPENNILKTEKILPFILLILFLSAIQPAMAQDEAPEAVGELVSVENSVRIMRNETEIAGNPGEPLFAGDVVTTGENSRAVFTLNGTGRFEVEASSETAIDELAEISQEEESQPVIRLVVGQLRAIINKGFGGEEDGSRPVIHTPTAVAGVRGTEFDTVVSEDGSTAIVVDEGSVEVENETGKALVATGQMTEMDIEATEVRAVQAVPREKRDWKVWKGKREKDMMKNFSRNASLYRQHFEKWSTQYSAHLEALKEAERGVAEAMDQVDAAQQGGNPAAIEATTVLFEARSRELKIAVNQSRYQFNRFKSMSRYMEKIGKHARKQLGSEEFAALQKDILFFKQKSREIESGSRDMFKRLKKTAKKAKKIKKKHRKDKANKGHRPEHEKKYHPDKKQKEDKSLRKHGKKGKHESEADYGPVFQEP